MEEEKSLLEGIFWGEVSPADAMTHRSKAAQKSYEEYVQAYEHLSKKLRQINPELDRELDDLFSVHYDYIGDMHAHAFSIGCSMGIRLMKEAMNMPIGIEA